MTKKDETTVKWKLAEKPTAENLQILVQMGILQKEEARKIVLEESVVTQSDIEAVKSELGLLRELILEISRKQPTYVQPSIVQIIERFVPQYRGNWTAPYTFYCSGNTGTMGTTVASGTALGTTTTTY